MNLNTKEVIENKIILANDNDGFLFSAYIIEAIHLRKVNTLIVFHFLQNCQEHS